MGRCFAARASVFSVLLLLAGPVSGNDDRLGDSLDQDRALKARRNGEIIPLGSVMKAARSRGKVLDVQIRGGRYVLKILDKNGRIRYIDGDSLDGSGGRDRERLGGDGDRDRHGGDSSGSREEREDSSGRGGGDEGSGSRGRDGRR